MENNEVTLTIMVEKKTRREIKAHATLLGLSVKEYILSLYALDKENDLIKKVIHKDCSPVSLRPNRQGESRCL